MSIIFFWKGANYYKDMLLGPSYELNQNNELVYNLLPGEHIWAFTRRIDKVYVLAADLIATNTIINQPNSPGAEYGQYKAICDKQGSRYFDVAGGLNAEPLIRRLSFDTIRKLALGSSFQGLNAVKRLTSTDEAELMNFALKSPII